jgi:hypothetical protein
LEADGGPPTSDCEGYCARTQGCDRDCVHACAVAHALCPDKWDAALSCAGEAAHCDATWGLPKSAPGCEAAFSAAEQCAGEVSCPNEQSGELCLGCCASYHSAGAITWQADFHDCACRECPDECGASYCGSSSGSLLACDLCTQERCTSDVSNACRLDPDCRAYDLCAVECPVDESSNCSEEATLAGCQHCCTGDFPAGADRYSELLGDCACNACSSDCTDSVICWGFDIIKPACQLCIDQSCHDQLATTCGSSAEPACSSFMVCQETCAASY